MKGLIVEEPWIDLILSGRKTWDMRQTPCRHRGRIALIRSGSGMIVGTARVIDSLPPLVTAESYAAARPFHCIPEQRQGRARQNGWVRPWVLAESKPLPRPIPFRIPYGLTVWVKLPPEMTARIDEMTTMNAGAW